MSTVNRRHKDRLFGFLFGNEAHRDWTLSLYNAVSGSSHSNPDDILITTISDVIYMGMKALEDMPDDFLIRSSLLANRAEVKNMCITEYNETETMLMFKEEGRREGRAEGHAQDQAEGRAQGRREAETHFGKLMSILFSKGLTEEAKQISVDENMRNELYKKYGID